MHPPFAFQHLLHCLLEFDHGADAARRDRNAPGHADPDAIGAVEIGFPCREVNKMRTNGSQYTDQVKVENVVGNGDRAALELFLVGLEIFAPIHAQSVCDLDQEKADSLQPQPIDTAQALVCKAFLQVRIIFVKVDLTQLLDLDHVRTAPLGILIIKLVSVVHNRHPLRVIHSV